MHCHGCGQEMAAVRARAGDPASAEAPGEAGEVLLDRCDACGRTWYDAGELAQVLGRGFEGAEFRCEEPLRHSRCPTCGAEVATGASRCHFCQGETAILCPRCQDPLFRIRLAGFRLEYCLSCGGLGLDDGEATAIAASLGITAPAAAPPPLPVRPPGHTCTRCGRTGLALSQTMCTEDGLVCERCGIGQAQEESAEWVRKQEQDSVRTSNLVTGVLLGALAAGGRRRR
jgi:Zn-finger nucleic acid-binding protein